MRRRNNPLYFPSTPDAPPPLVAQVNRKVRFEEVDTLGIVWHGRYPSYIEDGRTAFGEKFGRVGATGYTVQLLTNMKMEVLLARPEFVEEFCRRWKEKRLHE